MPKIIKIDSCVSELEPNKITFFHTRCSW